MPGITDLAVFNSLGQPTVHIDIDRERAARYGLAPGDINATVTGGDRRPGGRQPVRGRQRPAISRSWCGWRREYRGSLDAIRRITDRRAESRPAAASCRCRCAMSPSVRLVSGASFIYRENQERYIPIKFSVRGRDLGSAVLEAQQQDRRAGAAAGRLSAGMGRRIRRVCRTPCSAWRSSCRSACC